MALIACKECGNSVSSEAISCPKCGYQIRSLTGRIITALGLFSIIAGICSFPVASGNELFGRLAFICILSGIIAVVIALKS